jgi:hypothetical protein
VDSKAAIQRILSHTRRGHHKTKLPNDLDLMTIIIENTKAIQHTIRISWIKGHQDDKKAYDTLPLRARLNIDADRLATRHRLQDKKEVKENTNHIAAQQISISINGIRIQSQVESSIRFHVNGYHLRQIMQAKHKWSDSA